MTGVITQNVDLLHTKAGSRTVVNLHGTYANVICLDCGHRMTRARLAERLEALNPAFASDADRSRWRPTRMRWSPTRRRSDRRLPACAACSSPTSCTSARTYPKMVLHKHIH